VARAFLICLFYHFADKSSVLEFDPSFWRQAMSTTVVAYKILEGATKAQLEELVKVAISKGWQPLGGVSVAGNLFYQAMVGI
jgi:hypothetical protein